MFATIKADLGRMTGPSSSLLQRLQIIRRGVGFQVLVGYRFGRWIRRVFGAPALAPLRWLLLAVQWPLHTIMSKAYGVRIDPRADIGPGFYIGHFGGVEIGPCRIGATCSLHQHVRIVPDADGGAPTLGDRVWIGAHATICGPWTIGDGASITAGAVVRKDVRPGCLVSGDPARVIALKYDNEVILGLRRGESARTEAAS